MSRYLLDTDHISPLAHNQPNVVAHLARQSPNDVLIGPVSVEEVLRGRLAVLSRRLAGPALIQAYAELIRSVRFMNTFPVAPFDPSCEQHFQQLLASRLRVGSQDLKIAATALAHGLIVVTRNRSDFGPVPGLTIEDWSAP